MENITSGVAQGPAISARPEHTGKVQVGDVGTVLEEPTRATVEHIFVTSVLQTPFPSQDQSSVHLVLLENSRQLDPRHALLARLDSTGLEPAEGAKFVLQTLIATQLVFSK